MIKKILLPFSVFFVCTFSLSAQEKYALLIGIDNYKSPKIRDLQYSEADTRYLRDILYKFARFERNNTTVLLGSEATYARIKKEIYELGRKAKKDDLVFFYYSGHGTRVPDTDGNEEDGMDEAFCPYETEVNDPSTVILDDELGHWFRRVKSEKIVIVLDCCFSGGAAGRALENDHAKGLEMAGSTASRGLLNKDAELYAEDLSGQNKFIMTAAAADEQSYENPKLGHGIFTYYIGEAIRGNADFDGDRLITSAEIFQYTKTKTIEFVKSINKKQTPVKFGNLEQTVISEVGNQITDLRLFDYDLGIVALGIGGNSVKEGDIFVIKKNLQGGSRDLEIVDREIFKIKITRVAVNFSEGEIIERYYNVNIDPSRYGEYYAEKLVLSSLFINTTPWSTVYLDGKKFGPTPLTIPDVNQGDHELEFRINIIGYPAKVNKKIKVEGNKKLRIVEKFSKK